MNKSYIYSETAFHHEGDREFLERLINATAKSGADGIKFQVLISPSELLSPLHTDFDRFSGFCFPEKTWREIFLFTTTNKLGIICAPLGIESLKLAIESAVDFIDIHPVMINDLVFLERVKKSNTRVILGIGGLTGHEISDFVDYFKDNIDTLMVGFQAFPTDTEDIRIEKIAHLKNKYPGIKIGYADHTIFSDKSMIKTVELARALGATVFENHVTIEEGNKKTDSTSAISFSKFSDLIKRIKYMDGNNLSTQDNFNLSLPEIQYRNRQKKVVAKRQLEGGSKIMAEDVELKMIDKENGFYRVSDVIGRRLKSIVMKNDIITNEQIEG